MTPRDTRFACVSQIHRGADRWSCRARARTHAARAYRSYPNEIWIWIRDSHIESAIARVSTRQFSRCNQLLIVARCTHDGRYLSVRCRCTVVQIIPPMRERQRRNRDGRRARFAATRLDQMSPPPLPVKRSSVVKRSDTTVCYLWHSARLFGTICGIQCKIFDIVVRRCVSMRAWIIYAIDLCPVLYMKRRRAMRYIYMYIRYSVFQNTRKCKKCVQIKRDLELWIRARVCYTLELPLPVCFFFFFFRSIFSARRIRERRFARNCDKRDSREIERQI